MLIALLIGITAWAAKVGELSVCLNYWAEIGYGMPMSIVGCGGILGFILAKDNRTLVGCIIFLLIIIAVLSGSFKVAASLAEKYDKDVQRASEEKQNAEESDAPQYVKIPYDQETDPFMERLEEYCGAEKGSIADEEKPGKMAGVITADILALRKGEKKTGLIPEVYSQNIQIADGQYRTYLYQRNRDKGSDLYDTLKGMRISDLLDAKNWRIEADQEHEDPENRRVIGLYCIDYGDEYALDDQKRAADSYEEAAVWGMKAFYTAAISGNFQKVQEAYDILSDASDDMDKLSGIGQEKKDKLKNCCSAYEIVLSAL